MATCAALGRIARRRVAAAAAAAVGLAVLGGLAAPAARAGREADHDRARAAVQAGEVLPLPQLLERVQRLYPGRVLELELERDDGDDDRRERRDPPLPRAPAASSAPTRPPAGGTTGGTTNVSTSGATSGAAGGAAAAAGAARAAPGGTGPERPRQRWIYEIKLLQADGQLLKLEVDAATAQVLKVRRGEGKRGRDTGGSREGRSGGARP